MTKESMRSLDSAENATIDVMALNNRIVSMRNPVKNARVRVIRKLIRHIKNLRSKKGTEEMKGKNSRKADRLVEEIHAVKNLNPDKISKFAIGNTLSFTELCKKGTASVESRAMTRLSENQVIQREVEKFRKSHPDWKSLSAFLLMKQSGRRYRRKKNTPTSEKVDTNIKARETMMKTYLDKKLVEKAGREIDSDDDDDEEDDDDDDDESDDDDDDDDNDDDSNDDDDDDVKYLKKKSKSIKSKSVNKKALEKKISDVNENSSSENSESDSEDEKSDDDMENKLLIKSKNAEKDSSIEESSEGENESRDEEESKDEESESSSEGENESSDEEESKDEESESSKENAKTDASSKKVAKKGGLKLAVLQKMFPSRASTSDSESDDKETDANPIKTKLKQKILKEMLPDDDSSEDEDTDEEDEDTDSNSEESSEADQGTPVANKTKAVKRSAEMVVKKIRLQDLEHDEDLKSKKPGPREVPDILLSESIPSVKKKKDTFFADSDSDEEDGEEVSDSDDDEEEDDIVEEEEGDENEDGESEEDEEKGKHSFQSTFIGTLAHKKTMKKHERGGREFHSTRGQGEFRGRGQEFQQRGRGNFRGTGDFRGRGRGDFRGRVRRDFRGRGRGDFRGRGRGRDDFRGRGRGDFRGRGRDDDFKSRGRGDFRGKGEFRGRGRGDMKGRGDFRARGDFRGRGRGEFRGRGRGGDNRGKEGHNFRDKSNFSRGKGEKFGRGGRGREDRGRFDSHSSRGGFGWKENRWSTEKPMNSSSKADGKQEVLHPSWAASKRKKEQSSIHSFQGKKIKFDD